MPDPLLLWEVKTLESDAPAQVRAAVGQLLYYEFFDVRPLWPDREILKAALFDGELPKDLVDYLTWVNVAAFVMLPGGTLSALNSAAATIQAVLDELTEG